MAGTHATRTVQKAHDCHRERQRRDRDNAGPLCALAAAIARLAGHSSRRTTETICRREPCQVITTGAEVMDQIFQPKQRRGAPAEAAG